MTTVSGPRVRPSSTLAPTADALRELALRALARMYRRGQGMFAFRLRRKNGQDVLEGTSVRYTAIALIGLARQPEDVATGILAGEGPMDVCSRLLKEAESFQDVGEVALTLWAARALGHPDAPKALQRLRGMDPVHESHPTVELSWCLTSLACAGELADKQLAASICERLLASFNRRTGMFPHWPAGSKAPFLRRHVSCFADFVYPIQSLSYYHMATAVGEADEAARLCARRMCELQGPHGQWWWHFDVRTGRVVERYPVYAVHQDAMAPMALSALAKACGDQHTWAIQAGLAWLQHAPEIGSSLIDDAADVIWRKVARHEPGKLVRGLQASASRLHPTLRAPGMNLAFRPGWIDYESRPYHMGWILDTWPT